MQGQKISTFKKRGRKAQNNLCMQSDSNTGWPRGGNCWLLTAGPLKPSHNDVPRGAEMCFRHNKKSTAGIGVPVALVEWVVKCPV